jgi:ubiquinone/menaquinone biosynthesis C-methylase UbiE
MSIDHETEQQVNIIQHFNKNAQYYQKNYASQQGLANNLVQEYLEYLKSHCLNKDILEVGCGPGHLMMELKPYCKSIVGIDFSEKMVKLAKDQGLHACLSKATKIPFQDETFDCVYMIRTFQHINEYQLVLKECKRVLKNNGILIFDYINFKNPLGLLRSLLSGYYGFIYLNAFNESYLKKKLNQSGLQLLADHNLIHGLDNANLKKYKVPQRVINILKKLKEGIIYKRFFYKFCLRRFIICKKI